MGLETRVPCPAGIPAWPAVAAALTRKGCPVEMRMIDGELAFPDEPPRDDWRELRVAAGGAMVTVRRGDGEVALVTWGTADAAQSRLAQALGEAFGEVASGGASGPPG